VKTLLMWLIFAASLLFAILASPTSIVAAIFLISAALYSLPPVRTRYLENLAGGKLLGNKTTIAILVLSWLIALMFIGNSQRTADIDRAVKMYNQDRNAFLETAKKHLQDKDYFKAQYDLNLALKGLPNEESLQKLKHQIFIAETKSLIEKNELFLVENNYKEYKDLMGSASRADEIQAIYEPAAIQKIDRDLQQNDTTAAEIEIKRLTDMFPASTVRSSVEKKILSKKAALEKEARTLEPASGASANASESSSENSSASNNKNSVLKTMQVGTSYNNYSDGKCTNDRAKVCVDEAYYKEMCLLAQGMTKNAVLMRAALSYGDLKAVLEGGETSTPSIKLGKSSSGTTNCFIFFEASGIVKGTSTKLDVNGRVNSFIKTSSGVVLVESFQ
jgi:hypothetical protein